MLVVSVTEKSAAALLQSGRSWGCGIVDGLAEPAWSVGSGIRSIKVFVEGLLLRGSLIVYIALHNAIASEGQSIYALFNWPCYRYTIQLLNGILKVLA